MALTKAEMAERLFEELGLNKREAKEMVEMFFEEIRSSLEQGGQVKLSGFGNFDLGDLKIGKYRHLEPHEVGIGLRHMQQPHLGRKLVGQYRGLVHDLIGRGGQIESDK